MFLEQLEQIAVTQDVHFMTVKRRKDNGAWEVCVARPGTKKLIRKSSLDWSRAEAIAYEQRLLAQEHSLEEALDRWLAEYVPFLRKQFENAREECGMEHINWHDLRHTFASWLIQKNTPLQVVKELMGHANIGMTMRYAHLEIENLKTAVHAL